MRTKLLILVALLTVVAMIISACAPPPKLLAAGQPCSIAVDSTHVYWTEGCSSETNPPGGKIWKVPISGGEAKLIAQDLNRPAKISVAAGKLYWTQLGPGPGQVWVMSVDGGQKIAVGQDVISSRARPIVQGNYVYWTNGLNVRRAPIDGSNPPGEDVTHFPNEPAYDVYDFVLDGSFVYYSRWIGGMIEKLDLTNPQSPIELARNFASSSTGVVEERPAAIATDGTYVYWGEHASNTPITGTIKLVEKAGGTVKTIVKNVKNICDLTTDDSYVYWTDDSGVHKTLKDGKGPIINISPSGANSDIMVENGRIFWGDGKGVYVYQP